MADTSVYNKNDKVTINKFIERFVKNINIINREIPEFIVNTKGRQIQIDANVNAYLTQIKNQHYPYENDKLNIYNKRFTDINDFLSKFQFPQIAFPDAYKLIESKDFAYAINNIVENRYQYNSSLIEKSIQYVELREYYDLLNNLLIDGKTLNPSSMIHYNEMFPYFRTNTGTRTKPALRE
jgi:hypothetical protein